MLIKQNDKYFLTKNLESLKNHTDTGLGRYLLKSKKYVQQQSQ